MPNEDQSINPDLLAKAAKISTDTITALVRAEQAAEQAATTGQEGATDFDPFDALGDFEPPAPLCPPIGIDDILGD